MSKIDYRSEVLKAYPDAYCDGSDVDDYSSAYWITTPYKDDICEAIGKDENPSEYSAWKSAYETLKNTQP